MKCARLKIGSFSGGPPSPPSQAEKTRARAEALPQKGHPPRRLPRQFRHGGFDYHQIARKLRGAIYAQKRSGAIVAYEVIRVRQRSAFVIKGRTIEAAEVYPSSEKWGTDAWTLHNREAAFAKLKQIIR